MSGKIKCKCFAIIYFRKKYTKIAGKKKINRIQNKYNEELI